jgi:hypothetical protein
MEDNLKPTEDPTRPPEWADGLLRLFLEPDQAETESGDLLEAYRDSIRPQRGRWRADFWFVRQVVGYIVRAKAISVRSCLAGGGIVLFWLIALLLGGGVTLLATIAGSVATVISVPVLAISSRRSAAIKLSALWVVYLVFYLVVSTGMAWFPYYFKAPTHLAIGQEICADSGCFAVDKADKTDGGSEATYTLFWHLASNDKQQAKHFPGKGLELYMVDEGGRTFKLPPSANQDPLDVMLPAGETVRQTMTFKIPSDARKLFLTAKYRRYTFQSLLPGELSLVRSPDANLIEIQ